MKIRIRETGEVVSEKQFRTLHNQTSFPKQLLESILNDFGADIVFEGPEATNLEFWQVSIPSGVEQIAGKWYTKHIAGPVFETQLEQDEYVAQRTQEKLLNAKATKAAEIASQYDAAIAPLEAAYSKKERDTWPQQVSEARAYQVDATAPTPLVNALRASRGKGETATILANKIITNYTAFSDVVGAALGTMQARNEALAAIDLNAPDAQIKIEAV